MQQGVPDGRDVRPEAGLRHNLPAGAVQALRPDTKEVPPRPENANRHCEVAEGGQPGGHDREDRGGHPGDQRPNTGDTEPTPGKAGENHLSGTGDEQDAKIRCIEQRTTLMNSKTAMI